MRKHEPFILKPMSSLVEEAVLSVSGMTSLIDCYPLCRYVKDALMLQLTGFQEQKLKCIMWEMATDDLEFRYRYILQKKLGECSNISDKQEIYKHIIRQIRKKEVGYKLPEAIREENVNSIKELMNKLFANTLLKAGSEREFKDYLDLVNGLTNKSFGFDEQLINGKIGGLDSVKFYNDYLYRQRNRLAHNTSSYQENLPSFDQLSDPYSKLLNYFLFYAYLMMMDGVFVEVFRKYIQIV